jgi:hypothetical protein
MRPAYLIVIGSILLLFNIGCVDLPEPRPIPDTVSGMAPIYVDSTEAFTITTSEARAIEDGGAFVIIGDTLYVVEQGKGIHVIDNRDVSAPTPVSFIRIPGCVSVTANGRYLYVNNISDLVTLDVADPSNVVEVDREQGLYPTPPDYPENYTGFYTCYDSSNGYIVGWEEDIISTPECFVL